MREAAGGGGECGGPEAGEREPGGTAGGGQAVERHVLEAQRGDVPGEEQVSDRERTTVRERGNEWGT